MDYRDSLFPLDNYSLSNYPDSICPSAGAAKKATVELTILADFIWKPSIDGATEIKYLSNNKWQPPTLDHEAITGISTSKLFSITLIFTVIKLPFGQQAAKEFTAHKVLISNDLCQLG